MLGRSDWSLGVSRGAATCNPSLIDRTIVIVAAVVGLTGCFAPRARKPLFGGDADPASPPTLAGGEQPGLPRPARPHRVTPADRLIQELREGEAADRRQVADELVGRGPAAREDLRIARDQELVLVDVPHYHTTRFEPHLEKAAEWLREIWRGKPDR